MPSVLHTGGIVSSRRHLPERPALPGLGKLMDRVCVDIANCPAVQAEQEPKSAAVVRRTYEDLLSSRVDLCGM